MELSWMQMYCFEISLHYKLWNVGIWSNDISMDSCMDFIVFKWMNQSNEIERMKVFK